MAFTAGVVLQLFNIGDANVGNDCEESLNHMHLPNEVTQQSAQGTYAVQREEKPKCNPAILTIAMPADTNPAGDIFGGWLLAQMDLAAGSAAARRAKGRCATAAIEKLNFLSPVKVGDEVAVYATLLSVGRTSMRFMVEAWRRSRDRDLTVKVTDAVFTFVALDGEGKPRPVPAF